MRAEVESRTRRTLERARRHWEWGRSQGFSRLIEEDELDPFVRVRNAAKKMLWRRKHGSLPGAAVPVYLVGVQRSGTNMLVRGLQTRPEIEVYNESNRRAFCRFRLRSDETISSLIASSRHRFILFKPLIDSHRIVHLLDNVSGGERGRALWAYRNVDDRVRSSLAKFGDANLRALSEIAAGVGSERWEAQGLSPERIELIRSFDWGRMSPASAAALFWYLRNSLYFDLGLERRSDVLPVSYDLFVSEPAGSMRTVCGFIGFPWDPELIAHVSARGARGAPPIPIDGTVRKLCRRLQQQLDAAQERARAQVSVAVPRVPSSR